MPQYGHEIPDQGKMKCKGDYGITICKSVNVYYQLLHNSNCSNKLIKCHKESFKHTGTKMITVYNLYIKICINLSL